MNRSAFGRCIGLLRRREPLVAPPAEPEEAPPDRSVVLLWTGPGLGNDRTDGV
ncbi:hypothetical protein [Mycobacterium seoulense]|uniref:hypothetical protein n=1 Tax=Mycobacterium seoulense TaxID=386911 RepID=UPI0021F3B2DA|nr:hypothetical protein [Mycobacterium seoulense]MCV7435592.1 hypothetical protein [Mycobacterium seoulense]